MTREMMITKMSTLLVYVLLMCVVILVLSNTNVEKRFVQDVSLNGHICQEGHVVFHVNFSKVSCSVKCLDYPFCTGIFYDSDSNQCTGCASRNKVIDVTQQQYTYYKLEMKSHYIGCFYDCPRILEETYTESSSMTAEFCISHCLSKSSMYALTEHGSQCFCGNSGIFMDQNVQAPDTDCNFNCHGNSNEKCGGFCRGSVYHTG